MTLAVFTRCTTALIKALPQVSIMFVGFLEFVVFIVFACPVE
jgi:hypothetical protein